MAFCRVSGGGRDAGFARAPERSEGETSEASEHHRPGRGLRHRAPDVDEQVLIIVIVEIAAVRQIFPSDIGARGAMPSAVRLREDYSAEELAHAGPPVEGRQPEPTASVVGSGSRRNGPRGGGEDRRHGPPDAARLGSPLQRLGSGGPHRQLDGRSRSLACRRSNWRSLRRSSRLARIARKTASCAGGASISSASSPRGSASTSIARYVGTLLKKLGFSHISARPRHPAQDERIVEAFKKTSHAR